MTRPRRAQSRIPHIDRETVIIIAAFIAAAIIGIIAGSILSLIVNT